MSRLLVTALTGVTLLTSLVLTSSTAHAADFPFTLIRANISGVDKCIGPQERRHDQRHPGGADGLQPTLARHRPRWLGP